MSKKKIIEPAKFLPFINKQTLFGASWGLKKNNQSDINELEEAFSSTKQFVLNSNIKGIVFYKKFAITTNKDTISFPEHRISWQFPTINNQNIASLAKNLIILQVVTLGKPVIKIYEKLEEEKKYSQAFYFHGFTTWMTEALAQYSHNTLRNELGSRLPPQRFSFGYPLCPDLSMQKDLFKLLELDNSSEVTLTENFMMYPEQSTSALILH